MIQQLLTQAWIHAAMCFKADEGNESNLTFRHEWRHLIGVLSEMGCKVLAAEELHSLVMKDSLSPVYSSLSPQTICEPLQKIFPPLHPEACH